MSKILITGAATAFGREAAARLVRGATRCSSTRAIAHAPTRRSAVPGAASAVAADPLLPQAATHSAVTDEGAQEALLALCAKLTGHSLDQPGGAV